MRRFNCIQIELTNNCNYKCPNCPRSADQMTRKKGFVNINTVKRLLNESYGIAQYVNFSFFGEPLLHLNFIEIMDYTKNKPHNFKTVINTNMSLMTREIMDKLIDSRLSQLRISLDAISNETYDLVRPSRICLDLDGNRVSENRIDAMDEKINYWFSLKKHVPTRHVFPVSSLNVHEVLGYIQKWQPKLFVYDEILVKNILTYGGKNFDSRIVSAPCNVWDLGVLTVDWQGNVSPCNLDTNMDLVIGNIKDGSLMEIWNNPVFDELKKKSLAKTIFPCNKCIDSNNWSKNISVKKDNSFSVSKNKIVKLYGADVLK